MISKELKSMGYNRFAYNKKMRKGVCLINASYVNNTDDISFDVVDYNKTENRRIAMVVVGNCEGRVKSIGYAGEFSEDIRDIIYKVLENEDWFVSNYTDEYVFFRVKNRQKTRGFQKKRITYVFNAPPNKRRYVIVYNEDGVEKMVKLSARSEGHAIHRFRKKYTGGVIKNIFCKKRLGLARFL